MIRLSTKNVISLLLVLFLFASIVESGSIWPIKRQIDLSSGFGDFRQNRFHAGIDIRTGGKTGVDIYSPVNGYVYRIKMSYEGYGKGLYIKGDDNYIYVFAHLSNFSSKIDDPVKQVQMNNKRYYLDMYFPKDSIRISEGEFIGYTGQTGVGAPHLHFEKRTADNFPINPLTNGYNLGDKFKPVFNQIGFKLTDDYSLFDNRLREMFFEVSYDEKEKKYFLDTVLYFHKPFAILTDVYDKMREGGMIQSVYKLSLYIDNKVYYKVSFDSLDFETSSAVNLEYDYIRAVNDEKHVHRLFHRQNNVFAGSKAVNSTKGIFGASGNEKIGYHRGEIIAEDCFGNKAELQFEFLWGPPGNIYTLDSTATAPPKNTFFYFTPIKEVKELDIDSVIIFMNKGKMWGTLNKSKVTELENGYIKCEVIGQNVRTAVLRLFVFSNGSVIRDNIFNGIITRGKRNTTLNYQLVDDGLLVTTNVQSKKGSKARLEFYYKDSLLGIEYPQFYNMKEYVCFIPPSRKYARIDKIGYSMSEDTSYPGNFLDSLNIYAVGYDDKQIIDIDEFCSLYFNKDNFFEPRFIEVKKTRIITRGTIGLNSDHYQIFPEAFVCRKEFEISLKLSPENPFNSQSGICWLDEKENHWVWLDNVYDDNLLRAKSTGGGSFAAVFDFKPPEIKHLSIIDSRTYHNRQPSIHFILSDTLSGIEDDRRIVIKLDGQWMIPEYDPESEQCQSKPLEPLDYGKHHLGIMVTDRAGNITEQYLNFFVKKSNQKGKYSR